MATLQEIQTRLIPGEKWPRHASVPDPTADYSPRCFPCHWAPSGHLSSYCCYSRRGQTYLGV